jgi:hypothetical protein
VQRQKWLKIEKISISKIVKRKQIFSAENIVRHLYQNHHSIFALKIRKSHYLQNHIGGGFEWLKNGNHQKIIKMSLALVALG